jgi:hypothetical protein
LLASGLVIALLGPAASCSFDTSGLATDVSTDLKVDRSTLDGSSDARDLATVDAPADSAADAAADVPPGLDAPVSDGPVSDGPAPDGPSTPWWDVSWKRRRKLTFKNAARNQDLNGFPALVKLNTTRVDYSAMDSVGKDLRFVDQDHKTVLAHQIESWSAGGTSHVWVRVPKIDKSSAIDHIWLYYGNKGATDGQNASSVWTASFAGVWHLAGDFKDSSANNNHATNHGTTTGASWLASGRSFDGNDYIELPQSSSLSPSALSVELWFRTSQSWDQPYWPGSASLISRATAGCGSSDWTVVGGRSASESGNGGRVVVGVGRQTGSACDVLFTSSGKKNDGKPHHLIWTRTAAGKNLIYIDGSQDATGSDAGGSIAASRPIQIGGEQHHGGAWFKGMIDEVRISSVVRSALWVDAQHASMIDALISYGPEQSL